jgi:hypothetical protein
MPEVANAGVILGATVPIRFNKVGKGEYQGSALYENVRRPTRGIQLKDETFATIRIIDGEGDHIPMVNAGSRIIPTFEYNGETRTSSDVYSNFFIQQVEEQRMEKQQIVETFGEPFIFFYGERPRIISIAGTLLNTFDFNWEAEWWHNYETVLRGTKCVENDARVYLTYDNTLIVGYIFAATASKLAAERNWIPFNFQMFVTDYVTFSELGNPSADQARTPPVGGDRQVYGPSLLPVPPNIRLTGWSPISPGPDMNEPGASAAMAAVSLYNSINSTITGLNSLFNTVTSFADNAMTNLDSWLGGPVRIPIGWAGAFEYPVESTFKIVDFNQAAPITYTTFSDNWDEFVVGNGQYDSSSPELGYGRETQAPSPATVMEAARVAWARYGLFPPPDSLSFITGLLNRTAPGAMLLGRARGWLQKNVAPITGEISKYSRIATDVTYAAGQVLPLGLAVAAVGQDTSYVGSLFGKGATEQVVGGYSMVFGRSGVSIGGW